MQIPVMNGIYTDNNSDFRTSYPVNLIPVPKVQGISNGYLRPAEGIIEFSELPAIDRGGIVWNGVCYRVCGQKLVSISKDGKVTDIGDLKGYGQCNFDYSFDYLAINTGPHLYLFDGKELKKITDEDLGKVKDVIWVDGYFMFTDGEFIAITELNNSFEINPLKYGSSEVDPDPIHALIKLRNEVYVLNRHTIEAFDNVGGEFFPFQRIDGAMSTKGTIGTNTCCEFLDAIAFLGSGRNEPAAIYITSNGNTQRISTREVEQRIHEFDEVVLSKCLMETRSKDGHQWLYLHLPNQTLVYDAAASQATEEQTWFVLSSNGQYTARNHVWAYDKWLVAHPTLPKLGYLTNQQGEHWGEVVEWQFGTSIVYNESMGAIFHELELVCLTGRNITGTSPTISTQYSSDGVIWSNPRVIKSGSSGQRDKRLIWLQQGMMQNWRIQRFTGTSESRLSIARLEAKLEPLGV